MAAKKLIKLNANENFYGCSPKVVSFIKKNAHIVSSYPNYTPEKLEQAIAQKLNVSANCVAVGAGSVRIIDGILQSLVKPENEILIFENSFVAYYQLADIHQIQYKLIPQQQFVCKLENVIPYVTNKTKLIFIANPNNPTGTAITHKELVQFINKIPTSVLVIVDEAYIEYATKKNIAKPLNLISKHKNIVVIRTFSKAYGLAGLRIGYVIADEKIIAQLKNNRIPFTINCFAEKAALTALSDETFLNSCVQKNKTEKEFLFSSLKKKGYQVVSSEANFLFVYFKKEEEKEKVYHALLDKNLVICNLKIFGQEKCLRIGIGDRKINKQIIASMV
ncbi:MAG: histidinol-phosphate transaminase [Flavobacteriales bacterium]|nr:histidinol-phosphate transaminase [Flavobacteriales bacterium]